MCGCELWESYRGTSFRIVQLFAQDIEEPLFFPKLATMLYTVSAPGETMITFERHNATNLYRVSSASPGGDGYLVFYLIAGDATDALTAAQTWHDAIGYYVFLKQEPADLDSFVIALASFFAGASPARTSWAWLSFTPEANGAIEGTIIHSTEDAGLAAAETNAPSVPQLHNYAVNLMRQALLGTVEPPSDDIAKFTLVHPPVATKAADNEASDFQNIAAFSRDVHLSLTGPNRGCIMGKISASDFAVEGWVGLYYFIQGATSIVPQFYPVVNVYPSTPVMFAMSFDPLDQLNPDRTYLQFTDEQREPVQAANAVAEYKEEPLPPFVMDSKFRTIYGERIGLLPVTAPVPPGRRGARLVQQPLPDGGYYIAPDGDFMMVLLSDNSGSSSEREESNLLLGVSGLESIAFREESPTVEGNYVSFFPFMPAYVPVFPLLKSETQPSSASVDNMSLITSRKDCVTSWITVGPPLTPTDVLYFAQPDGAALYREEDGAGSDGNILTYFAATAAVLPDPKTTTCFPVAPVTTVVPATDEFGPDFIRNFELQILSPTRRAIIQQVSTSLSQASESASDDDDATEKYGTTPQGFLTKVDGFQWKELLLASNTDVNTGTVQSLAFTDLNPTLQAAFQTNQQFLVITSDTYLKEGGTKFQNTIPIEGWPFFIDVSLNEVGNYRNVIISKFSEGSVTERVRDTRLWTDPTNFNSTEDDNLNKLSSWLVAYIENARERAAHDAAFANFVEIVDDPEWNGILALNVTIGLSDFPPELKGLLAGIDLERFAAHHFGINVNFVQPDGNGGLEMVPQSSMFGLIDYVDESLAASNIQNVEESQSTAKEFAPVVLEANGNPPFYEQPYQFVVLTLQVVFSNSEIKNFTSTIKLTINQLFSEAVRNPDSSDLEANAIILDGSYEDHNGARSYVFNIRKSIYFRLIGKVVDHVEIIKAQFSTLQSIPVPGTTDEIVQSRFSFWGTMGFYNVADDFDIFSFDSLSYASMYVDMSFALSAPETPLFGFNPAAMTFDPLGSKARNNSVFKNFPLQLRGVVYNGNSTGRPTDMGFMAVKTPLTGYSNSIDNTWYALSFTLNLGTPGALAASLGFTAQMYAAWSPVFDTRTKNPISVNFQLPRGGGNKSQLSLQGVLQLAIRSIKFNTTLDDETGNRAFLLIFERIALRVLGLNLPTNATLDAVLFGNPDPDSTPGSLGWYFAYNKTTTSALASTREQKQLPIKSEVE